MPVNVHLTTYQRRVLWLISQGHSVNSAAAAVGTHRQSITDSLSLIHEKLGAQTHAQAVLLGYLGGHIGVREDCGTRLAYVRHMDASEDACPACKAANARWLKEQSSPRLDPLPLTEPQIRLLRALHSGRTHRELAILWGVGRSTLHRTVTETYRRLRVDDLPRAQRREAAMNRALELGYLNANAPRLPSPKLPPSGHGLTPLQIETLKAVDGRSLSQAGARLGISRTDISSRLHLIYAKLGISHLHRHEKRGAALRIARERGYDL